MQDSGFRIQDSGFRIQDSGFRIQDSGFRIQDSGFRIQDSGFRIQDSGFRIQDSGFRIQDWRPPQAEAANPVDSFQTGQTGRTGRTLSESMKFNHQPSVPVTAPCILHPASCIQHHLARQEPHAGLPGQLVQVGEIQRIIALFRHMFAVAGGIRGERGQAP